MGEALDIPLTAIRAFVAVGRHGSFTRAAAALKVTQGAVSRHVATLEEMSGVKLFDRSASPIRMTTEGSLYFDAVKDAISTIELATHQICQLSQQHDRLRIRTSMPSFAMTVMVPALGNFAARNPIHVDLITSLHPPLPQDEFDVLITRDLSISGTESWELLSEDLVCVGSPSVVAKHRTTAHSRWPMIAAKSRPDVLALWAAASDVQPDRLHINAMYDHLFLAVAASIGGTGLLVVPRLLVLDHLRAGTLEAVSGEPIASGAIYKAYIHPQSRHLQASREFCRWLKGMLRMRSESSF